MADGSDERLFELRQLGDGYTATNQENQAAEDSAHGSIYAHPGWIFKPGQPAESAPIYSLRSPREIVGMGYKVHAESGVPVYTGTIDATTTSKTCTQATTPFGTSASLAPAAGTGDHRFFLVQNAEASTVSVRVSAVATPTGTVSNTRGTGFAPSIRPGERVLLKISLDLPYIAAIALSSGANVDIFELIS